MIHVNIDKCKWACILCFFADKGNWMSYHYKVSWCSMMGPKIAVWGAIRRVQEVQGVLGEPHPSRVVWRASHCKSPTRRTTARSRLSRRWVTSPNSGGIYMYFGIQVLTQMFFFDSMYFRAHPNTCLNTTKKLWSHFIKLMSNYNITPGAV